MAVWGQYAHTLIIIFAVAEVNSQFFDFFQPYVQTYMPTQTPMIIQKQRPYEIAYINVNGPNYRNPVTPIQNALGTQRTTNIRTIQTTAIPNIYIQSSYPSKINNVFMPTQTNKDRKPSQSNKTNSNNNFNRRTNNDRNTNRRRTTQPTQIKEQNQNNDRRKNKRRPIYENDNLNNVNYFTERPHYQEIITHKPNFNNENRYTQDYSNSNRQPNQWTTNNPYNGVVRPVGNVNRPPITNKPLDKVTEKPNYYHDDSAIAFPQDNDDGPEFLIGPDEDFMSQTEKRRHIENGERACDKYKSLQVKQLSAIPLLPSPDPISVNITKCAPSNIPLVVGGNIVSIQEFPHMALLGWGRISGGGYSWKCGGSLISEHHVLTAAHCSYQERDNTVSVGPPKVVQLGSSFLDDPGAIVVKVTSATKHPKYKLPKSYYDLAILKLASRVHFSERIKPACVGVPPSPGYPVIATGWGRTEAGGQQSHELRSVSISVWDIRRCHNVLGTSRKLPEGPDSASQVCAGEEQGGKDTCQGDSGGPIQIQDGCTWRVVGVTSLGRSCGAARTPGLYAIAQRVFISAVVFG